MEISDFERLRRFTPTSAGRIAWYEAGQGPTALFVHGFPLTAYHWRKQMSALADIRRCVAVDLLALGYTEPAAGVPITYVRQAAMLAEWIEAEQLGPVDLVGNDSGGSISQILATTRPDLVRSLTLTNCEVRDNNPPEALLPLVEAARVGATGDMLAAVLADLEAGRQGFASAFRDPAAALTRERAEYALRPIVASEARKALAAEYLVNLSAQDTIDAAKKLVELECPVLVVWGDADEFMPVHWAHWLEEHVPSVRKKVVLPGAKLFFPEEDGDAERLSEELRVFYTAA